MGGRFDPWSPKKNLGREAAGPKQLFQTSGLKKAFFATPRQVRNQPISSLGVKNGAPHARSEMSFFLTSYHLRVSPRAVRKKLKFEYYNYELSF